MKTREEEILAMGMGPRRKMPEETETNKNTGTFVDVEGNEFKPFYQGDIKINPVKNKEPREIKRGEEGYRTREFSYDLESDPLWQQYISSARRNGQNAMTDTMAKVASQTGGIAGSYAVAAGAGAYNDYMQRANDVIPELEQIAYRKYQDDLARDREIYEMDEAKRLEKAQYNAALSTHQNYGRPLTDEEKMLVYANGGYITPDGDVVDANGNLIAKGTKYDEEVATDYRTLIGNFQNYGKPLTDAEQAMIYANGGYISPEGHIVDKEGNYYHRGTKYDTEMALAEQAKAGEKVNLALTNYMLGKELGADDIMLLMDLGYNYSQGILYDASGKPIAQTYKKPEVVKSSGSGTGGKKENEDSSGSGNGSKKGNWDIFVEAAYKGIKSAAIEKKINGYVNIFKERKGIFPGIDTIWGNDGKYVYDSELDETANAALFVNSLDEDDDMKQAIFDAITEG